MHFLHPLDSEKELTYQDVFLMPQYSDVVSRMNVDLSPQDGTGMTLPIIVSNMTAVAGRRMAETVTRRGGMVLLTQDMSFERIEEIVKATKVCHPVFETPIVLDEHESVQTALNLINKRAHRAVVIIDKQNKPVGIFTEKDAYRRDRYNRLVDVMTRDLITVPSTQTPKEIFQTLHERRLSIAPVVNLDGTLAGVMTKKGCVRAVQYKPALNTNGHLLTAVAVRIRSGLDETLDILKQLGVDMIVLDTAHGHQKTMIDAVKKTRSILGADASIMAGNIVSESAAKDFD
jgi:IMP dehydrogenase